ncbi:alpha/beta hydrolase [Arthrobacter sp. lap29]|nr:alpha/beta hydrolase [Arthrobacter sp. lap29]
MTASTAPNNEQQRDHEPERPERPAKPAHQIPDVPRRLFFLSMGAGALTTAFQANIALDARFTERSQYRITTPDNDENKVAAARFPGKTWYLLGGFRVSYRDAGRKLQALQPAMNQRASASFIGYSNEGIDIASLFIAIQRDVFARKIDTVYFYGDSFGGMAAVVLASLLTQIGVKVRVIVMGSSPSDVADTLDPGKEYISIAGKVVPYLGLVGRLAAGLWGGLANPNGQGMYEAARSGVARSFDPNNNSLILSTTQATFLQAFPRQYDGDVPTSTGIGLIYDPEDFIVNAAQAIRGWESLLPSNPHFVYNVPHTGHASPEIHPEIYRTALMVVLDTLDPPPLTVKPEQPIF